MTEKKKTYIFEDNQEAFIGEIDNVVNDPRSFNWKRDDIDKYAEKIIAEARRYMVDGDDAFSEMVCDYIVTALERAYVAFAPQVWTGYPAYYSADEPLPDADYLFNAINKPKNVCMKSWRQNYLRVLEVSCAHGLAPWAKYWEAPYTAWVVDFGYDDVWKVYNEKNAVIDNVRLAEGSRYSFRLDAKCPYDYEELLDVIFNIKSEDWDRPDIDERAEWLCAACHDVLKLDERNYGKLRFHAVQTFLENAIDNALESFFPWIGMYGPMLNVSFYSGHGDQTWGPLHGKNNWGPSEYGYYYSLRCGILKKLVLRTGEQMMEPYWSKDISLAHICLYWWNKIKKAAANPSLTDWDDIIPSDMPIGDIAYFMQCKLFWYPDTHYCFDHLPSSLDTWCQGDEIKVATDFIIAAFDHNWQDFKNIVFASPLYYEDDEKRHLHSCVRNGRYLFDPDNYRHAYHSKIDEKTWTTSQNEIKNVMKKHGVNIEKLPQVTNFVKATYKDNRLQSRLRSNRS